MQRHLPDLRWVKDPHPPPVRQWNFISVGRMLSGPKWVYLMHRFP